MTRFVALLRGINVGGRNAVPMADLRGALDDVGLAGARTYIQSGNIIVDAAGSADALADRVHAALADRFGLQIPVIVVTADELTRIVAANPYPDEREYRRLHAIVLPESPDEAGLAALAERVEAARARPGANIGDSITVVGRVAYLHTPAGFGTSELAKAVGTGARNPVSRGTARNWATVTTLRDMTAAT